VLVAFVQGVIGTFHENSGPFHERGGEKSGERADEDLLKESGVHPFLKATLVPVSKLFAEDVDLLGTRVAYFSAIMADSVQTKANEAESLTRLLDLELAQKRATWKHAGERARSIRAAGFVFLFALVVACLIGGYFAFMRVSAQRANPPASAIDR